MRSNMSNTMIFHNEIGVNITGIPLTKTIVRSTIKLACNQSNGKHKPRKEKGNVSQ